MNILILVVKGFIIGIGKVIPGVSGAMLAMSFGLYEPCLEAITHFFKDIKRNILLLSSLGFGILLAIVLGSKIIAFLLVKYYLPVTLLFIGFIIGGMIPFYQMIKRYPKKRSNYISFLCCFLIVISLSFVQTNHASFLETLHLPTLYFFIGIIDASTMVIPGISGTAVFMMLGLYQKVLLLFANLDSIEHITYNLSILFPFCFGLGIGVMIISVIMNYLLKRKKDGTYYGILGFQISALLVIFMETLTKNYGIVEIVIGCFLLLIGIKSAKYLE